MNKQDVERWFDEKRFPIKTEAMANLITQCFADLQPQWVSIGKEDNYAELMKAGSLTFWHKVHKCEVTGWIVKNELENLIQGEYLVIEMTKTTQWPIDAFTFLRAPSLPPAKELNHEE